MTAPAVAPRSSPRAPARRPRPPLGKRGLTAVLVGGLAARGHGGRGADADAACRRACCRGPRPVRLPPRRPAGWEHTGGLPERRRSLLTRVGTPQGTDLIAVERTPLGYDADAEPERAAAEMRAAFDKSAAAGARLSGYGTAEIGGRSVTTYRQQERDGAVVEWYVALDGDAQLSVGCRHTPAGTDAGAGGVRRSVVDRIRRA